MSVPRKRAVPPRAKSQEPQAAELLGPRPPELASGGREIRPMVTSPPKPILVLMGVSGCGKSTVAGILAGRLSWKFDEGDDMHPAANVEKMHSGHPLTDQDRWPWLGRIKEWIDERVDAGEPAIVTCSALKRSYRDVLRGDSVVFVYLHGTHDQIAERLRARHGHFMPAALLDSQFADLEPPTLDEQSVTVDIGDFPGQLADEIETGLGLAARSSR
jgi:gluconokinase